MVYLINQVGTDIWKVGMSKDPGLRSQELQVGNPMAIKLKFVVSGGDSSALESKIHDWLREDRIRGEWFTITSVTLRLLLARLSRFEVLGANGYEQKCLVEPGYFKSRQALSPVLPGSDKDRVKRAMDNIMEVGINFLSYSRLAKEAGLSEYLVKNAVYGMLLVTDMFKYNEKIKRKQDENKRGKEVGRK